MVGEVDNDNKTLPFCVCGFRGELERMRTCDGDRLTKNKEEKENETNDKVKIVTLVFFFS